MRIDLNPKPSAGAAAGAAAIIMPAGIIGVSGMLSRFFKAQFKSET